MGWEPITYCPECGEAHDVYLQGPCECCVEILRIDAEMAQERYVRAARDARLKKEVRTANDFMTAMNDLNPGAAHEPR